MKNIYKKRKTEKFKNENNKNEIRRAYFRRVLLQGWVLLVESFLVRGRRGVRMVRWSRWLVFVWGAVLCGFWGLCFSAVCCQYWRHFYFLGEGRWVITLQSFVLFLIFPSPLETHEAIGIQLPSLLLIITLRFTCSKKFVKIPKILKILCPWL